MSNIYLDYAAATPMDPAVLEAMQPYFIDKFYNPSATYLAARSVRDDLQTARHRVAGWLGARPTEIIFTAGATEANNLAIQGLLQQYPKTELLISAIEHESVLGPAKRYKHKQIPTDQKGLIKLNMLSNLITDNTVLVSVMLVNNELGTVQPLQAVAKLVDDIRNQRRLTKKKLPLYLHTDAAQAGNYLDLHTSRLGVDMLTLNGGKIYGPKQSGLLYVKTGTQLKPLIVGGGQEFGMRSGTENVTGAIGLAAALNIAQTTRLEQSKKVLELRNLFETEIQRNVSNSIVNGSKKMRAPHITSLSLPGSDNERLMMELDERGIQCAVGSACSASREEASHVLSAIGLDDKIAQSTLRFSFGKFTTPADIKKTIKELADLTLHNR